MMVEIWASVGRVAMHPRAVAPKQRLNLPGQWKGFETGDSGPRRQALASQVAAREFERRPLDVYEAIAIGST